MVGDRIIYLGKSTIHFTKYKEYVIIEESLFLSSHDRNHKTLCVNFINDLDGIEWLSYDELKKMNFLNIKIYRKLKLKKLNNANT